MKFIADLRSRRRGNLFFLWLVFSLLVFMTGKVVLHLLWPDPALDKVDLAREWAIIPFFALPWIGWFYMVRLHRQHHKRHPDYENSINASVVALLDDNRSERARYKVIAGLLVASALWLPFIVHQLQAVGKVENETWIPAFVIYPSFVLFVLVWAFFYYRSKLLPRKRELESLLAEYNADSARPGATS